MCACVHEADGRRVCPQEEKKKGAVINVSSAAGVLPCGARHSHTRTHTRAHTHIPTHTLHPLAHPPTHAAGDPLYAVYSASKAYVDFLSRSLHAELRAKGVFVQCQVPYFVTTKLSKLRRASLLIPTPDTYARAAVSWIGAKPRHQAHARTYTHTHSHTLWWLLQVGAVPPSCPTAPTPCSTGS